MNPSRVMIVDDSAVVRRMLTELVQSESSFVLAGTASNGRQALERLEQFKPDIVILDVEMPELDGLQTVPLLRARAPRLPVVMFSALTESAVSNTLQALALGASDYITKPQSTGGFTDTMAQLRLELVPKLKALCGAARPNPGKLPPALTLKSKGAAPVRPLPGNLVAKATPTANIDVLAIGSSTGGPNALATLFGALPASLPVPVVIAQHMPPMFTRMLAARLNGLSGLSVQEAREGDVLTPGKAYLAPGDFHMVVTKARGVPAVQLHQGAAVNSCRPSVDVLFDSVVKLYGARTLAVVLTGMGQDGLQSCKQLRAAGGTIVVQDKDTSVVWGMPGFIARAGIADAVLPIHAIGTDILKRISASRSFGASVESLRANQ